VSVTVTRMRHMLDEEEKEGAWRTG